MAVYYNENDPFAAEWLRQLIRAGVIAPGDVDDRSIVDVTPIELKPYDQHHFFAGIGVWSYALRQAGWPDDKPVWTGSCPCQPFSAAGKRGGSSDDRDLWWAFFWLISQCQPETVFGEQVASKDGLSWWDTVQTDLEGAGYAATAFDLCAAGIGAPHIRQRLFWVADSRQQGLEKLSIKPARPERQTTERGSQASELADASDVRCQQRQHCGNLEGAAGAESKHEPSQHADSAFGRSRISGLADSKGSKRGFHHAPDIGKTDAQINSLANTSNITVNGQQRLAAKHPGPTNDHWRDADWLLCRDGKWRPVEPGTFPLANGAPARVGRLRGYGNAIVAPLAQAFIEAYQEVSA